MPRRADIHKILLLGSGPIVIGQGCEFDYSGTQGAKALLELGYEVVLVNSNPATIMTDSELVGRTYVEPLERASVQAILERERPDALLPTLGGQTALNLAIELHQSGLLEQLGIELIGARVDAIRRAEDRCMFKEAMTRIGLESASSGYARTVEEVRAIAAELGFPLVLRPSFTLGGLGGGIVESPEQLEKKAEWALSQSPTHEVLVEQSLLGWKEFELEVIRDRADNFIVVCTIENLDPMGVHTGDSITVAPAMTLTDREYQRLRDAARAVMQEIGVETGGANVQFAVDPESGRVLVIEMNPRVSRSSALASKATGYPIAKVAAKLAVGMTLDELRNDITRTSAAFEPVLDYVVVKWPRFAFEKFPGAEPRLGTQMQSVGEAMAIGRSFSEALQKAARSLELGREGLVTLIGRVDYHALAAALTAERDPMLDAPPAAVSPPTRIGGESYELRPLIEQLISRPGPDRLFYVADAFRLGCSLEQVHARTAIDPWFLEHVRGLVEHEAALRESKYVDRELLQTSKRLGFSDAQIATLVGASDAEIRALRTCFELRPTYARVDTCAAELTTRTPYLYSAYETESESEVSGRQKVIVLGSGPNRIGQGIEFDYCCCHAAFALRELGIETIMINCNPETVSTDPDTADRLYFEPLTLEDVLAIVEEERQRGELLGVIVQLGGQTPLRLSGALERAGVVLLGTTADAIDRAEDRERFDALLAKLGLMRPTSGIARSVSEALMVGRALGFPVLVRPSYVLGGRAMVVCSNEDELASQAELALEVSRETGNNTLLIDALLQNAIEVDVDCLCDGKRAVIAGVMQHIEEAGVHSGDSTSVLPPYSLPRTIIAQVEEQVRRIALELGVIGLLNVQLAVIAEDIYVLEVNPRASRTVPFVSKATGQSLAKVATKLMVGCTLDELGVHERPVGPYVAVKEAVFSFTRLRGVDTILGPEMKSTGEVMGIAADFPSAFGKAQLAAGVRLPRGGTALVSVKDADKALACELAQRLCSLGFRVVATPGTAAALRNAHIPVGAVHKIGEGSPDVAELISARGIDLVINSAEGTQAVRESFGIRRCALQANVPYFTTVAAARAAVATMEAWALTRDRAPDVSSLQEWHAAGATR